MFRGNPAFNSDAVKTAYSVADKPMTINGTLGKTFALVSIAAVSALIFVNAMLNGVITPAHYNIVMGGSIIISLILAFVTIAKPNLSPTLAPLYAITEGSAIGLISCIFEGHFPGIVLQAVALTFLSLFVMLFLYRTGTIKATEKFRSTILVTTIAIAVLYFISILGSFVPFLHFLQIPMITSSSPIGIAFSVIVCIIASLSFILDFDSIEQGARNFLPQYFEWYFGFGLLLTLIWLYVEALRLLSKLRDR